MEFTPADTLKKDFEVEGSFYNITLQNKDYQCRNQLESFEKVSTPPIQKMLFLSLLTLEAALLQIHPSRFLLV